MIADAEASFRWWGHLIDVASFTMPLIFFIWWLIFLRFHYAASPYFSISAFRYFLSDYHFSRPIFWMLIFSWLIALMPIFDAGFLDIFSASRHLFRCGWYADFSLADWLSKMIFDDYFRCWFFFGLRRRRLRFSSKPIFLFAFLIGFFW